MDITLLENTHWMDDPLHIFFWDKDDAGASANFLSISDKGFLLGVHKEKEYKRLHKELVRRLNSEL